MAITQTEIISNALMQLGHAPIQTLDNGDDLVISAIQAYNMLLPSVLSIGNWRFAVQIQQLTKTVDVPPEYYEAVYNLPAGFLKLIRLFPQTYAYDIFENRKLYTQFNTDSPIFMEYVFVPDVSRLPPAFVNYFVYEIAAYLALSNAQKPEFYSVLEARRIKMQGVALAADCQNRPNFSQRSFPVLNNRDYSGIISAGFIS